MAIKTPNLQESPEARFWFFNLAGMLASTLLGCAAGPALPALVWLVPARLLVALVLMMLPPGRLGIFRPYLLTAALLALALTQVLPTSETGFLCVVAVLFLLTDSSLDAMLAQRCPESEWLGRMAQLVLARTTGLLVGIGLGAALLEGSGYGRHVYIGLLLALTLVAASFAEGREPAGFRPARLVSESPWLDTLLGSMRLLGSAAVGWSHAVLFCVALIAGTSGAYLYPVPILTEGMLSAWLAKPGQSLGLAACVLVLALLIERWSRQSLRALAYGPVIGLLLVQLALPQERFLAGALQIALGLSLLVAFRQVLAAQTEMDPCLSGTFAVTIWTAGLLTGEVAAPGPARLLGSLVIGASLLLTLKQWRTVQNAPVVASGQTRSERYGDRRFDFAAAPIAQPRRRPRLKFEGAWLFLTVRFPITLTLAIAGSFAVAGLWHARDSKATYQSRVKDAWLGMQTQLFLTSLKLRVHEEMLTSNRIPNDWPGFIAASFQLDGRPMKDRDFWGTPLHFEVLPNEVRIVSAGPDRKLSTPDDIERRALRPDGVAER